METAKKRKTYHHNGGESKNGHHTPAQVSGRVPRAVSNGNVRQRNLLAARMVRGDVAPVRLNVAQAAALVCGTTAGIYGALRQI